MDGRRLVYFLKKGDLCIREFHPLPLSVEGVCSPPNRNKIIQQDMVQTPKTVDPQKVDYNDAVAASKEYFEGDELAAQVWVTKYALKDSFGNIYERTPREMHERIAAEIERIESKYPNPMKKEEVFSLLDHFRYIIPQGGPMTGIANPLSKSVSLICVIFFRMLHISIGSG